LTICFLQEEVFAELKCDFFWRKDLREEGFEKQKPAQKGNGLIVVEDFADIICYFYLYAIYSSSNYQEKTRHIFRNILYSLKDIRRTIHYGLKESMLVKIVGCY
jgi:hypothetical protein